MAEGDRVLLTHYKLVNLYPTEWPREKDDDDDDEEDDIPLPQTTSTSPPATSKSKLKREKYKSRYANLERGTSLRTGVPGSQLGKDGRPNLAQKDEADPLGTSGSVIKLLRGRGVHVEDDTQFRNQFLLSSTTFSPERFLSEVHSSASTDDLLRGLDYLSNSIEKKSASLKVLVESNFDLFVRAKATIDSVYREMRNHGADTESLGRPTHSRQSSRNLTHWRSASGTSQSSKAPILNEKRKNALIKESEYGVQGIKTPLLEANVKAEEVWGPALGGREREDSLKTVLSSIDKNKAIFETGISIEEDIKKRDYESLAEDYTRAQKFVSEAKVFVDRAKQNQVKLSDAQIHQIIIVSRVWMDIQTRLDQFKHDIWARLVSEHAETPSNTSPGQKSDEYLELISVLLQLGVDENPIIAWLQSRRSHLMNKIHSSFERMRIELEIARRRLANTNKPSAKVLAFHLKSAADSRQMDNPREPDAAQVLRFWEKISGSLNSFLSLQEGGLLGETMSFFDTTKAFLDGTKQKGLPIGVDGQSRKHHKFSDSEVRTMKDATVALFNLIHEQLNGLFVEPPIEDISQLFTPTPQTPQTPQFSATSPSISRFNFRPEDIPPSPRAGEAWEKFAFWPPNSNSLSASTFLSNLLSTVAVAAGEMASVDLVKKDNNIVSKLRNLVGDVRERSITAICAAWLKDSENMRELEDWTRSSDKKDVTNMPGYFSAFESSMLANLQKIVYIADAAGTPGSNLVILPPPQRHIETVQKTFKNGLYKAFSGMMEHAGKPAQSDSNVLEHQNGLNSNTQNALNAGLDADSVDANNVNLRKLLTMSNFQTLRKEIVPSLISQFESHFSMTISDDQKTAQDVLGQMNTGVFRSYVKPTVESLENLISNGISDSSYAPAGSERPSDAKPYIYDVLLALVLVHTEVSKTAPALTSPVLSHLLEQISTALIESFKKRKENYSLVALVQATLDVEFMAQTLNNYTTEKASDIQGKIYLALDERTDNEARMALQRELPEMRAVLKRLREGTKGEFVCFRKERKPKDKDRDKTKR